MEPCGARVVLVPYPFQGHLTPMLQLGALLHQRGFSITLAHTRFNSPNTSHYPHFHFLPLTDNLEGVDASFHNKLKFMATMNANCRPSFQEHMVQLLETEDVACVIYDNIMTFVDVVATMLNLPTILLRTTSAAYMHSHLALFHLTAHKRLPLPGTSMFGETMHPVYIPHTSCSHNQCGTLMFASLTNSRVAIVGFISPILYAESEVELPVPNLHPLRFKDLPVRATQNLPEPVRQFLLSYMNIRSSAAVIWNTVETLDQWPLQQLQQEWAVPFFTIGPLHKMAPPLPTSLMEEDVLCLSWLDKRPPNSVIYVSLGSLATIDQDELREMARGLAKSDHPFLWVVRPSLLSGPDAMESLPADLKDLVPERGLVVGWAPQRKVLEHPAVGGFFSHCGWNSTLESLCGGVPMICRPCFADQLVNARYLTHVWGVGLEIGSVVEKSVEGAVRTLMGSDCGRGMRERAAGMKLEIERSMGRGGSSSESLHHLVKFVASL